MNIRLVITLFAVAFMMACGKKGDPSPDTTIYAVGLEGGYPAYWKNGIEIRISNVDGWVNGGFVSGSDVYAGGYRMTNSIQTPTYWKDGASYSLPVVPGGTGQIYAMFVSGSDIHAAGVVYDPASANFLPTYWKNGTMIILDKTGNGSASAITVNGTDVLIAGSILTSPVYWKNGSATKLGTSGKARAIQVVGTDTYIAGDDNGSACYWKNGAKTTIAPGSNNIQFDLTSIYVSGADVYVAGSQTSLDTGTSSASYWKNGSLVTLSPNSKGTSIAVFGNDVYVGGYQNLYNLPVYWKNGQIVNLILPSSAGYANASGYVWSIFVE